MADNRRCLKTSTASPTTARVNDQRDKEIILDQETDKSMLIAQSVRKPLHGEPGLPLYPHPLWLCRKRPGPPAITLQHNERTFSRQVVRNVCLKCKWTPDYLHHSVAFSQAYPPNFQPLDAMIKGRTRYICLLLVGTTPHSRVARTNDTRVRLNDLSDHHNATPPRFSAYEVDIGGGAQSLRHLTKLPQAAG